MTKEIDVSKIDVGWRVQLDGNRWTNYERFHGKWVTICERLDFGFRAGLGGKKITFGNTDDNFLAALPPEPAKDPFAPGEWVVCLSRPRACTGPAQSGDILKVSEYHWNTPETWFGVDSFGYEKAHFRPATPEEIAGHLKKKLEETPISQRTVEQCSEALSAKLAAEKDAPKATDAAPDGKITFTVAGREFFVGQRVWNKESGGMLEVGDELEIIGANPTSGTGLVLVRKPGTCHASWAHPQLLDFVAPPSHDWKFGDQASHPDHGYVLVIDMTEPEAVQCSSPSDPEIFIDPAELTFIRRTDLGN